MKTEYFQGRDGYVWWNGVVEDRKDPLFLGRCKVRILGWHTSDKTELPVDSLPWAQVLMPITSASQTGVGESPVGPVEGTWVMGFYRDGELAQEPVMVGTLHGIPENYAKVNTGFNDSRLDTTNTDLNAQDSTGKAKPAGNPVSLTSWPYPPKEVKIEYGQEVDVVDYTDPERREFTSQSLYPRELNKPTTSIYARGEDDTSTNVLSSNASIVKLKTGNRDTVEFTSKYVQPPNINRHISDEAELASFASTNEVYKITQPPTPYAAEYPFNHVYESESGHLVEIDDTPTKERMNWYHRTGTFTEFHPKGMRVDRTVAHRYNITSGNQESIIRGHELKSIGEDYAVDIGGKLLLNAEKEVRLISEKQNVIIDSQSLNTIIKGKHVVIAAEDTLLLKGKSKIVRDDDSAEDKVKGSYKLGVQGEYGINAGKLTMGSFGATNITSFGPMTQTVTGSSEESITNIDVILGNVNAKMIKAFLGKIVLETVDMILTGGIDLNVGPGGVAAQVALKAPLGDIDIISNTGPSGINIRALTKSTLQGIVQAEVKGALVNIEADALTQIKGALVTVGGSSEPALLGKSMLDIFKDHYHPSSVGPTGPLHPSFAFKLLGAMSKKVFLG